jgi:transposase-like protein
MANKKEDALKASPADWNAGSETSKMYWNFRPSGVVRLQDHRAIKRRVRASQHFRSFWGAWHTIAGYEANIMTIV